LTLPPPERLRLADFDELEERDELAVLRSLLDDDERATRRGDRWVRSADLGADTASMSPCDEKRRPSARAVSAVKAVAKINSSPAAIDPKIPVNRDSLEP
jgi:hypothetical protein